MCSHGTRCLLHSVGKYLSETLRAILRHVAAILPHQYFCPSAVQDTSRPEEAEEPVTALPLFDGTMIAYAYARGRFVGIESSSRAVLLRDQLPDQIFSDAHRLTQIPRLKCCDEDKKDFVEAFKAKHLDAFRPALLVDCAAGWPALSKWDLDFFATTCGHIDVHVTLQHGKKSISSLKDYLELLRSAGASTSQKPGTLPYLRG